jgi:hypothetical protein
MRNAKREMRNAKCEMHCHPEAAASSRLKDLEGPINTKAALAAFRSTPLMILRSR